MHGVNVQDHSFETIIFRQVVPTFENLSTLCTTISRANLHSRRCRRCAIYRRGPGGSRPSTSDYVELIDLSGGMLQLTNVADANFLRQSIHNLVKYKVLKPRKSLRKLNKKCRSVLLSIKLLIIFFQVKVTDRRLLFLY
jgi:hypothetical protein